MGNKRRIGAGEEESIGKQGRERRPFHTSLGVIVNVIKVTAK